MDILASLIIGWLSGSFINYVSDTLPFTRRLGQPVCPRCQQPTSWHHYLTLINHSCGHKHRIRNVVTQIIAVLASFWLLRHNPEGLIITNWPRIANYTLSLIVALYFMAVFIMDVEHRVVMHPVSITGIVIGLGIGLMLNGWRSTLIGGASGFGIMYTLYLLGELFMKLRARRHGITAEGEVALGFGDVNLAGVLGLFLGWPAIWVGLLTAILVAGIFSLLVVLGMLLFRRYDAMAAIPYAPFMVLAAAWILFH